MSDLSLTDAISLHQAEAEWMFAGAVSINPEYARESCGWLRPERLRDERIQRYWASVLANVEPMDAALKAGIYYEVFSRVSQVSSSFDVTAFADAISQDRFLTNAANMLTKMAQAIAGRNIGDLRKLSQSISEDAPISKTRLPNAVDIGLNFNASLDDAETLIVPTGIKPLDRNMGGYEKSTLTIIGGRPGMGKTSFGLQSATENARAGLRTLYFSLEMSERDLWARMACGRAQVDWRKVTSKTTTDEELEKVKRASRELYEELDDNFIVDAAPMTTSEDIFRRVSEYRPDLVIVDHLDLVDRKDRGKVNEVIRVGNISRMGKVIAKQFDIPTVYLMQLNRATESRDDKRPVLSDLRASGEVEQDADVVAFLYRPDYYDRDKRKDIVVSCEIWLEKVRSGQSGIKADTKLNLLEQHFYPIDFVNQEAR